MKIDLNGNKRNRTDVSCVQSTYSPTELYSLSKRRDMFAAIVFIPLINSIVAGLAGRWIGRNGAR